MCITKQKKILLSQGKYQFTDEAKSHTLKAMNQAVFQTGGAAWSRFYMKRCNIANFVTADGKASGCSLHKPYSDCPELSQVTSMLQAQQTGTGLCSAQWNFSPDEVFRIAIDCKYKVYYRNNFPLEKLRHSKSYWRSQFKADDESRLKKKNQNSLFPRLRTDWISILKWSLCNDRAGFGSPTQSTTVSCLFFHTNSHLSVLSLHFLNLLLEKGQVREGEKLLWEDVKNRIQVFFFFFLTEMTTDFDYMTLWTECRIRLVIPVQVKFSPSGILGLPALPT